MSENYGKGPSQAEWASHEELLNTGSKGWNYLQRIPEILKQEIPWLRDKEIAFADQGDIEEFSYQGWRPIRSEHFGTEGLVNFNKTVGYRFNLSDVDGVVRYRNLILMMMPKDFRKRLIRQRNEKYEDYYSRVTE